MRSRRDNGDIGRRDDALAAPIPQNVLSNVRVPGRKFVLGRHELPFDRSLTPLQQHKWEDPAHLRSACMNMGAGVGIVTQKCPIYPLATWRASASWSLDILLGPNLFG
jgi:hypothetical protein